MAVRRFFGVVRWILLAQISTVLLAGVLVWMMAGWLAAGSAAVGGLIALLPNLYFSLKFGLRDDRRTAKEVVSRFYSAEVTKLILTAGLFMAVFQLPGIRVAPLIGGYMTTLTVFWFALLVRGNNL